jgi:hypothetical protein
MQAVTINTNAMSVCGSRTVSDSAMQCGFTSPDANLSGKVTFSHNDPQ